MEEPPDLTLKTDEEGRFLVEIHRIVWDPDSPSCFRVEKRLASMEPSPSFCCFCGRETTGISYRGRPLCRTCARAIQSIPLD